MNQSDSRTSSASTYENTVSLGQGKVVAAPRSGRVVKQSDSSTITAPSCSSLTSPPILPARSPLRPPPRSTPQSSTQSTLLNYQLTENVAMRPMTDSSFSDLPPSDVSYMIDSLFSTSTENVSISDVSADSSTIILSAAEPLSVAGFASSRPESPESMNSPEEERCERRSQARPGSSSLDSVTMVNSASPTSSKPSLVSQTSTMTKRQYALHELLSSERAYASDLALIKDIYIPLALGSTVPLTNIPASPPNSSGSSSRTQSAASDESSASLGPPMSPEDARIIFGNITEIAVFTHMFTEQLETALGSIVEGGQGNDSVGALFLRVAPDLERPYNCYITRHPAALQHLQNLPQTPALQHYLSYTQTISSTLSHAWDLASLLIKPVQRLLKYPLLLAAIIDETPDGHPDKENLLAARTRIEEVARNVNEGRRRAEVVKDVLSSKTPKKPNTSVGVTASVGISKMMSIRHGGVTAATMRVSQLEGANNEAAQVESLQAELKRIDFSAQKFARAVVDWGKMTSNMMLALRTWSHSFGTVIGLTVGRSEAFDAFLDVVERGLLPLTSDLETTLNDRILKDLAHLLMTMNQPLKLITSMNEQEPYHYHLLTMPVTAKNRPPPSLLAASTNYLALRGQLAAELPTYIRLLNRGLTTLVGRLAEIQMTFWAEVRDRWVGLWEMLRAETELNVGREETCSVWRVRWAEVNQCLTVLTIATPVQELLVKYTREKEERKKEYQAMLARHKEKRFREAEEHKKRVVQERERNTERVLRGAIGPPPTSSQFRNPGRSQPSTPGRDLMTSPSSSSMINSKAAVDSIFAALGPRQSSKRAMSKKAKPVVIVDRPSDAFVSTSPESASPVSLFTTTSSTSTTLTHLKDRDDWGTEVTKRSRAFSADAGVSTGKTPRPPSSQDSMLSKSKISGPLRRKTDNSHLGPRSYASTNDFDDHFRTGVRHGGAQGGLSPQPRPYLTRMKSMPLSVGAADTKTMSSFADDELEADDYDYYEGQFADRFTHSYHGEQQNPQPHLSLSTKLPTPSDIRRLTPTKQQQRDSDGSGHLPVPNRSRSMTARESARGDGSSVRDSIVSRPRSRTRERGREGEKETEKESKDRPVQARKRSGSVKSITSFFTGNNNNSSESPPPLSASQRDSWVSKPAKYICQVVHPCKPPASVSYYSFPFFTLQQGDFFEILQEAGHPSIHPNLPLYVDDGEDCLLLCRDRDGVVGWALASFLEPVPITS